MAPARLLYLSLAVGLLPGPAPLWAQTPSSPADTAATAKPAAAGLPSQLVLRLDYAARALFAGRDYGIRQSLTTPSLTYNHRSGAYAGVSGAVYSQSTPAYALTDFTAGYGNVLGSKLLYNVAYDHYVFGGGAPAVLNNTGTVLLSYDLGPLSVGGSYAYLFGGGETGQRLVPSVSGYWAWKNLGFVDKLYVLPSVSATVGTENALVQLLPQKTETAAPGKTTKPKKGAPKAQPQTQEVQDFGLMSWNLALPVRVRVHHLTLGATYNFVVPVQLAHESALAGFANKSFLSFSLSYALSTGYGHGK